MTKNDSNKGRKNKPPEGFYDPVIATEPPSYNWKANKFIRFCPTSIFVQNLLIEILKENIRKVIMREWEFTIDQIVYLCNEPPFKIHRDKRENLKRLYKQLEKEGHKSFIPFDWWRMVMEDDYK